jgi:hypothetical protein
MTNLNEVVDGAGIGDYQPHQLQSQFFKGLPFQLKSSSVYS